ncbi:MAG TPA: hypothetical protein O0X97_03185 [Methanocorpusculum sp.]|nr:hypothetical protein [Methanocorpusculum sp.]
MKSHSVHLSLLILLSVLFLAACSTPAAAGLSTDIIPGTPFQYTLNSADKSLSISSVPDIAGSRELTPAAANAIPLSAAGLQWRDIRNLSISYEISGIASQTFKDASGLANLYFGNRSASVASDAFPSGKVYQIVITNDITHISTLWAVPGEEIDFVYSSVTQEGISPVTILQVSSQTPITIYSGVSGYIFFMPNNPVGLKVITDETGGPGSGGTSISYYICRVTVTSEPDITFTVQARLYNATSGRVETVDVPVISGVATVILSGDDKVYVTVTSYPSGNTLSAVTRGVKTSHWTGTTYTIDSYDSDADDGDVRVHLVSTGPVTPTPTKGGGGSSNPSILRYQIEPIPIQPLNITNIELISSKIYTKIVCDPSDLASIKAYLLYLKPSLTDEMADEITAILVNAVNTGILQETINREDLAVIIKNGKDTLNTYGVYGLSPDAENTGVRCILFSVPYADLASYGFTSEDVILYHGYPKDDIWVPLDTWLISADSASVYYAVIADTTSPFAVVFVKDSSLIFPWYIIAIIICGVVLGLVIVLYCWKRRHMKSLQK